MAQASACSDLTPSDDHLLISGKTRISNPCKYMPMTAYSRALLVLHGYSENRTLAVQINSFTRALSLADISDEFVDLR